MHVNTFHQIVLVNGQKNVLVNNLKNVLVNDFKNVVVNDFKNVLVNGEKNDTVLASDRLYNHCVHTAMHIDFCCIRCSIYHCLK